MTPLKFPFLSVPQRGIQKRPCRIRATRGINPKVQHKLGEVIISTESDSSRSPERRFSWLHRAPLLSIPFAGNYEWTNGALNNRGNNGNYWSSTPYSAEGAHNLNMNYGGNLNAQNGNNKVNGLTIRCVAE